MTTTIIRPKRVFMMSGVRLDDPDPNLSPERLRDEHFSVNFPHLASASIEGPEVTGGGTELTYRFVAPPAKTKG